MRKDYGAWLRGQGYDGGTITAQLHRVGRVEQYLGDLDRHYDHDRMRSVLEKLRYSTEDERRGHPNPTPIPINGTLRTNLASYRNAVALYGRHREGQGRPESRPASPQADPASLAPRVVAPKPRLAAEFAIPHEHARTLAEFGFDGRAALESLIATSRYRSAAQAVASLALFTHPDTVSQTKGAALFPTVRGPPGQYGEVGGRRVMFDDNKSPTDAFLWANGLNRRGRDTQFNHVYAVSQDIGSYTALPNIVMTPAFIAKLTDTDPEIRGLLAWRSFDLYGWFPQDHDPPVRPSGYAALEWAAPLPAVPALEERLVIIMARRQKDRTVMASRTLGWLYSLGASADDV
jgi:hypothetical protein